MWLTNFREWLTVYVGHLLWASLCYALGANQPSRDPVLRGLPSTSYSFNSCAQPASLTFSKTPVSIRIEWRNFPDSVPRYRPLIERFQYITRLMKRARLFARRHKSLQ